MSDTDAKLTSAWLKLASPFFVLLAACACSSSVGPSATPSPDSGEDSATTTDGPASIDGAATERCVDIEARMRTTLDAFAANPGMTSTQDFTVLLETGAGRAFSYSRGNSLPTTLYESASTSKWVSAAILLDLVDQGRMTLATTAASQLSFWRAPSVSLRDLLSFTSGFDDEPLCINGPSQGFVSCVENIYTRNASGAPAAGSEFHYSSTHLQVAGAMALQATTQPSWTAVFNAWRTRTGLFPNGAYDLPSSTNPRLAGGMHWTAVDYLAFLRALTRGEILSATTRAAMFANQRGTAAVGYSPTTMIGEDWAYGLGNWLECRNASFDCGEGHRNSSPGAYGAYPFIDFDHNYFGIVARQGGLGTFPEGVRTFRAIELDAATWADGRCNP